MNHRHPDADDRLKPCPFCGGPAGIVISRFDAQFYPRCLSRRECGVLGPHHEDLAEAIAKWNKRWSPPMDMVPLPGVEG